MPQLRWGLLDDNEHARDRPDRLEPLPEAVATDWLDPVAGGVDQLAAVLDPYDVLLAMRERTAFPRELLVALPRLKLLITTGMRNAAIDLTAATELGIVVAGAPGAGDGPAELTWALILAVQRHIPYEDRAVREGRWGTTIGATLAGRTLGLLGFGTIARKVARVGLAFDMRVIAYSRSLTAQRAAEHGAVAVSFDELFENSDVLSVHVPGGSATRGLVGARELALLPSHAILVNTARGPVVDEAALITALENGRLAGAGLDVFDREPLPAGHPLTRLDRVVLSPHRGYVTGVGYDAFYRNAADVLRSFVDGHSMNVLNPEVLTAGARRWPDLRA